MAYGLRVENDSGYLQVDENWVTYALTASGSSGALSGTFNNPDPYHVIHTGGDWPIVFARPSAAWSTQPEIGVLSITNSGKDVWLGAAFTGVINYRIYERVENLTSGTGYGLEVWDSAGDLSFSSEHEIARIKYKANSAPGGATVGTPIGSSTFSTSGPLPFGMMNGLGRYENDPGEGQDPGATYFDSWYWRSTGSVILSNIELIGGGATPGIYGNTTRVRLLADGG